MVKTLKAGVHFILAHTLLEAIVQHRNGERLYEGVFTFSLPADRPNDGEPAPFPQRMRRPAQVEHPRVRLQLSYEGSLRADYVKCSCHIDVTFGSDVHIRGQSGGGGWAGINKTDITVSISIATVFPRVPERLRGNRESPANQH